MFNNLEFSHLSYITNWYSTSTMDLIHYIPDTCIILARIDIPPSSVLLRRPLQRPLQYPPTL